MSTTTQSQRLPNLHVALLHDQMVDKQNKLVTTSVTLIDIHDFARSSKTYGVKSVFISHPSPSLRKLARSVKTHWLEGFGATYNENRKEAIELIEVVSDLDEAIQKLDLVYGRLPKLVATSARPGAGRISYPQFKSMLQDETPYLLLFGTGWGMSDALLSRTDYFLEPIKGPTAYNHLSVRGACAIILDRLLGQ